MGALGCAHAPRSGPRAAGAWRYTVRPDAALTRLEVELCFDGPTPSALVADLPSAAEPLDWARDAEGRALPVDVEAGQIDTSSLGRDACMRYQVNVERALAQDRARDARLLGDALLLRVSLWLWRPKRVLDDPSVTLEFAMPEGVGMRASVPWTQTAGGDAYVVPWTTFRWRSQVVLGPLEIERFTAAGAEFSVTTLDGEGAPALTAAGRRRWISTAAETVAQLYGAFPVPRVQLLVLPIDTSEPVAFGLTSRGGGASVLLLIGRDAPDDAFVGEWVAIHEFLHLSMPFIEAEDVWLSEGFVTYYTSVLRTRAGFRDEQDAWESILAGVERGRRSAQELSLREASVHMNERHVYDRVYWGGAAIALLSDVALRQGSDGRRSLDDAMRALHACCANSPRRWSAEDVYGVLDEWAGGAELRTIRDRELDRADYVELAPALRALGVQIEDDRVILTTGGRSAAVRGAIMGSSGARDREPGVGGGARVRGGA